MSSVKCFRIRETDKDIASPARAHDGDAGFDLRAAIEGELVSKSGRVLEVPTGFGFIIPVGMYGEIKARSGLAKIGVKVLGGVIDRTYRGEIIVLLEAPEGFSIRRGERIAQILFKHVYEGPLEEIQTEEVDQTERGHKGFGSSGTN